MRHDPECGIQLVSVYFKYMEQVGFLQLVKINQGNLAGFIHDTGQGGGFIVHRSGECGFESVDCGHKNKKNPFQPWIRPEEAMRICRKTCMRTGSEISSS
jgi:hypothetical protein